MSSLRIVARPETIISAVALVISVVALGISIYLSAVGLRTSVLPALVFVYDPEDGWLLRNVGNGPALDPIVSHTEHGSEKWIMPTRIYPIEINARVHLPWLRHNPDKIVVYYNDVHGRSYRSFVDEDRTQIDSGDFEAVWSPDKVRRVWER
jgi:hypothetical protein